jgi:hypothetical protein
VTLYRAPEARRRPLAAFTPEQRVGVRVEVGENAVEITKILLIVHLHLGRRQGANGCSLDRKACV